MSRVRRRTRPSFMVVVTLIVLLGMGISVAVQAFAGAQSTPAVVAVTR